MRKTKLLEVLFEQLIFSFRYKCSTHSAFADALYNNLGSIVHFLNRLSLYANNCLCECVREIIIMTSEPTQWTSVTFDAETTFPIHMQQHIHIHDSLDFRKSIKCICDGGRKWFLLKLINVAIIESIWLRRLSHRKPVNVCERVEIDCIINDFINFPV